MRPEMIAQMRSLCKRLATKRAVEGFLSSMYTFMVVEMITLRKRFRAIRAAVRSLPRMDAGVHFQVHLLRKRLWTRRALVWPDASMGHLVVLQKHLLGKCLCAVCAREVFRRADRNHDSVGRMDATVRRIGRIEVGNGSSSSRGFMVVEVCLTRERLAAYVTFKRLVATAMRMVMLMLDLMLVLVLRLWRRWYR